MNWLETLGREHANLQHLIKAIPFNDACKIDTIHFLNIYHLTYGDMLKLNEQGVKFPINSNKLLKLGISLGNLIKSLQSDEEVYMRQQQQQQRLFMNSLDPKTSKGNANPDHNEPYDPFKDNQPKNLKNSTNDTNQPTYHTTFIRNLLSILKNFDIGSNYSIHLLNHKLQEVSSSNSNATLNQYDVSTSPIKLNSNQLLIEKLEININLDTLFIYKIIIQLILKIYSNMEKHLHHIEASSNIEETPSDSTKANSSVFSVNYNSSSGSVDEYYKLLRQAISKISNGLIDPFTRLIINQIVQPSINSQVDSFINSFA